MNKKLKILLVEDNPGDVRLMQEMLKESFADSVELKFAECLSAGLAHVDDADAVLLDLGLPDSEGLGTLRTMHEMAAHIPIVVLTGLEDETTGVKAVQEGAQDYLVKGQVYGSLLVRSIRYAIERKRVEETLQKSRKKAEETRLENERLAAADKAKSEFLANMSHELRTPLNAAIGFSELLKEGMAGELSEKQKHYVDNILASSQFLLTLINDILDLSKIEAGKVELAPEKMSVPIAINETLCLIKEKAKKHNVLLKTEFDPDLEFIVADKQRFKQILFNLLSNAVKFSKEEGGVGTITAKKEGDMAKVSVSDTGIGIKEEEMGRLFHKFEQLEKVMSEKYGGTGLGLTITKQLVELHGGRIWGESRYGEGSTFTFLLPLKAKKGGYSFE